MSDVLNLGSHTMVEQRVNVLRRERGLWHHIHDDWPVEPGIELEASYSSQSAHHYDAIVELGAGMARMDIDGGSVNVNVYGESAEDARLALVELRALIPRAADSDPDVVPVTFWSLSPHGPQSLRRDIDAPAWDAIAANYPEAEHLERLLRDWEPGFGGQLILWHGDAGTGKTTALRSLGREWRDWAQLHYIVDPDRFFGDSAAYMMQVLIGESHDEAKTWRLLILEDCAEMLQPDARRDVGQALARLLNACDGLIGRGLRILILITTNEPLEKVHPAISRPGRCAARIEFRCFTHAEAQDWLGAERVPQRELTLADLYSIRDGYRTENGKQRVGFVR